MVSINSLEEHQFVTGLGGDALWLGGRRDPTNRQTWFWSDGTPWGYTNWAQNEPNDNGGNSDCSLIRLSGNDWGDKKCSQLRTFVCKKGKNLSPAQITSTPTAIPAQPECQVDWPEYNGECYKFFPEKKNYHDAKTECVAETVRRSLSNL